MIWRKIKKIAVHKATEFGLHEENAANFTSYFEKLLKDELITIYDLMQMYNLDPTCIFNITGISEEIKNKYKIRKENSTMV